MPVYVSPNYDFLCSCYNYIFDFFKGHIRTWFVVILSEPIGLYSSLMLNKTEGK